MARGTRRRRRHGRRRKRPDPPPIRPTLATTPPGPGHGGTMSLRVLIVDDHTVLSHALADALSLHGIGDVKVAAPHQLSPDALLALVDSVQPDVILLDLYLGDGNVSLPLLPRLKAAGPAVVVLTASEEDRKSTRLNSSHSQISYAVFCL